MSEQIDLLRRLEEPTTRRWWLLYKALECLPLDRAIDLARAAEAFVIGSPLESRTPEASVDPRPPIAQPRRPTSRATMMYLAARPKIPHRQTELA